MYFVNILTVEQGEDKSDEDAITLEKEEEAWRSQQEAARLKQGRPQCISNEEEYILWKERQWRLADCSRESNWKKKKHGQKELRKGSTRKKN
jgi:hypothetical protein